MSGTGIRFHRITVTVIRATAVGDAYGDQARDWTNAAEHDVTGCWMVPQTGGEYVIERDQIVRRWTLFAPPDADIRAIDRIRYAGTTYEVNGEVRQWASATGALAHLECDLLRVEG